jgi:hypothetical protein
MMRTRTTVILAEAIRSIIALSRGSSGRCPGMDRRVNPVAVGVAVIAVVPTCRHRRQQAEHEQKRWDKSSDCHSILSEITVECGGGVMAVYRLCHY